ncbi:MAG: Hpt domain-containing protein [Pseudomonadota bacterium]
MAYTSRDIGSAATAAVRDRSESVTDAARDEPVDLAHLARQTLDDADLEREVLGLFLSQTEIFLERLRGARTAESWRMAAHTIKGSARNIGAWHLAEVARVAEGYNPADRRAAAMVDKVADALGLTNRYIEGRLALA